MIQDLMPTEDEITCNCPHCNANPNFSYHGCYSRNLCIVADKNYDFKVWVTRVVCKSCGTTHALLPNFIIPYTMYSRDSVTKVISEASATSVPKAAKKFGLSVQLIYTFLKALYSFLAYLELFFKEINKFVHIPKKCLFSNCHTLFNDNLCYHFHKHTRKIFLMTKFHNYTSPPVTIGVNLMAFT